MAAASARHGGASAGAPGGDFLAGSWWNPLIKWILGSTNACSHPFRLAMLLCRPIMYVCTAGRLLPPARGLVAAPAGRPAFRTFQPPALCLIHI